ncbi:exopolyphosphatase [Sulfurirhabdus autotrophica]|uniref:Exopolyphosphatase n=1 Tax=Sulfurirhabdus autotrophica TaxID=1706046 RepID=A0A4V2W371_9PROT|nr:exopolyphosphatase [Sulfurirhabdus autotrophica]TCV90799.1 exopolyphosphatase/guanosine-5'-triphosphate,3'-diphosphate pyrophosphatase [Sulfurirhabdus autotrophica]
MEEYDIVAAVDLGSNSFRLQVARVVDDQIYPLDSLKETVRLGAGLTPEKFLDEDSQARALSCLKRFGERLRGLPIHAVRVVGTNTLRVAKNAPAFLTKAEEALGFQIEVIAGREEARLIYLGVAHSVPASQNHRLVVDIGGGSTECIIGEGLEPYKMESLYMGCVSYSLRFFPEGKITKDAMQNAEMAAKMELLSIRSKFSSGHWQEAIGSSGTARALADLLEQNGWSKVGITAEGLAQLRTVLLKAGDCKKLDLQGMKQDRIPVLPGGLAIMSAIFSELGIQQMNIAGAALREGVLYDLLGRFHHHDMRDATVKQFMRRYHVDPSQAFRVANFSSSLFVEVAQGLEEDIEELKQHLLWAADFHEIGISIAHSGYHKHSAYILEHADMPGFSKLEQSQLGLLVRAQRGSLSKVPGIADKPAYWLAILVLRLAVLFYRSRTDIEVPKIQLKLRDNEYRLKLEKGWLEQNPLTDNALQSEIKEWKSIGVSFSISNSKGD